MIFPTPQTLEEIDHTVLYTLLYKSGCIWKLYRAQKNYSNLLLISLASLFSPTVGDCRAFTTVCQV